MMAVEQAKSNAERIISDAKEKAKEIISKVTKREFLEAHLKEEEERSQAEAEAIIKTYLAETTEIKQVNEERLRRAASLVIKEVLEVR